MQMTTGFPSTTRRSSAARIMRATAVAVSSIAVALAIGALLAHLFPGTMAMIGERLGDGF